jgi:hypothetical protein
MMSRLVKSRLSGSKTKFPLVSTHTLPAAQTPNSARLSTVKRATKSPPGMPSPVGSKGISWGSMALLSPSSWLPAGSTISSKTVSVKRSSGSGSKKTRVTEACAASASPRSGSGPMNWATITSWMGITPLASPTSK